MLFIRFISFILKLIFSGTATVEQLFGQLMLMVDGCGKLDARQLQDVLKRLMITNAFRLLPVKIRGFPFLTLLKQHMKSYTPDDYDASGSVSLEYPVLKISDGIIVPKDSTFDKPSASAKKRKGSTLGQREPHRFHLDSKSEDINVRKYHKKF